jgi:large subunit ribosomal protein L4
MELKVFGNDGAKRPPLTVSDAAFGVPFNEPLVHQVVVAYQAAGRAGTSAQKTRAAVSGGGRKPFRQKGTGRARAGTIRSPLWRGGGKVFAAVPRDYAQKVNRKEYRLAMRSILSELVRQDRLVVCDDLTPAGPRTRQLAERLKALGSARALIVSAASEKNLELSARNLPHVAVLTVSELDPVSLVGFERVLVSPEAVKKIEAWLQ